MCCASAHIEGYFPYDSRVHVHMMIILVFDIYKEHMVSPLPFDKAFMDELTTRLPAIRFYQVSMNTWGPLMSRL